MYMACSIIGSQLLWTLYVLSSKNLDDKKIKDSYLNLYIGCDSRNKLGVFYFPFQRARMFLFIMIGALLFQYQVLEIVMIMILNFGSMECYYGVRPHVNKKRQTHEGFHELVIFASSVHLMLYSEAATPIV